MFSKELMKEVKELDQKWLEEYKKYYDGKEFKKTTYSGIPVKTVYTPEDIAHLNYKDMAMPGIYPYFRGVYPLTYQAQPWVNQQATAFGLPEQTKERYSKLSQEGLAGYEGREPVFFMGSDMSHTLGYDSDNPIAKGWVGMTGAAIDTIQDYEMLFDGVALDKRNITLGMFDTCHIALANLIVAAERQGISPDKLHGLTLNMFYRQMYMEIPTFSPRGALRINRDFIKYCSEHVPHFNTVNWATYDVTECGGNAIQEIAFIFAAIIAITDECIKIGLNPDKYLSRFAFHVAAHIDFFEVVAKMRAMRRMWAKLTKERYGCTNPRASKININIKTAGVSYTRQQPLNNLIRGTIETMAAIMGGVTSLWTTAYDEALAIPTEQSAILGLRTQQILLYESGVASVSDPLAGSYYVEWLTDKIEDEATKLLKRIEEMGGWMKCMEAGWFKKEVNREAIAWRRGVDSGERVMVGMNKFTKEQEPVPVFEYPDVEKISIERLKKFKAQRDTKKTMASIAALKKACVDVNEDRAVGLVMPALIECVRANATLQEMMDVLKEVFGWGLID